MNQPMSIHSDAATFAKSRLQQCGKRRLVKSILLRRQRNWRLLVKLALSGAVATVAGIAVIFGQAASF